MIRIVLGALIKGFTGFMTIIVMSMTLAPVTSSEAQFFGGDPDRFALAQVRLARAMMDVAPDFTVEAYAKATGAPVELVRYNLEQQAIGALLIAQADLGARRTEAGGALFVKVD